MQNYDGRIPFQPLKEFGEPIQQAAMPIVAKFDATLVPLGTGFMISADGLMMTAAHVLKDFAKRRGRALSAANEYFDEGELYALYASSERHPDIGGNYVGGLLPIRSAWYSEGMDIALCWLPVPTIDDRPLRLRLLRLTVEPPTVGQKVLGFGYHKMEGTVVDGPPGTAPTIDYKHDTAVAVGEVLDVHMLHRTRGFLDFPCFRTTARFDAGMSGGPIFNERGFVCGVVTSGDNFSDGSYGSLMWPAMACHLVAVPEAGRPPQPMLLLDLVRRGFVASDGSESRIEVTGSAEGDRQITLRD